MRLKNKMNLRDRLNQITEYDESEMVKTAIWTHGAHSKMRALYALLTNTHLRGLI